MVDVQVGTLSPRRKTRPRRVERVVVRQDLDTPVRRVADDLAVASCHENSPRVGPAGFIHCHRLINADGSKFAGLCANKQAQHRLLEVMAANPGKLFTHSWLLKKVWGPGYGTESNYSRLYVRQLRRKLADTPSAPRWITTEPGVGYRWLPEPDKA
jgi:hypothetical protein